MQQGEEADAVYFVKMGILEVIVGNTKVFTLKEGSFFGEQAFKTSTEGEHGTPRMVMRGQVFKQVKSYRTATVKAVTRCQLPMLHQNEFFRILQVFSWQLRTYISYNSLRRIFPISATSCSLSENTYSMERLSMQTL